jgi:hypothetical protein
VQVHVAVREAGPGAGLGLFAARDVQQGEVLLSLPTDLAFSRKANGVMVRLKGSRQQQSFTKSMGCRCMLARQGCLPALFNMKMETACLLAASSTAAGAGYDSMTATIHYWL